MPLQPRQLLNNRYQIIGLLGQGGMGSVYRAVDNAIRSTVAIKEQRPDPNATPAALAHARMQFQREAQVVANLNHPNLPRVTDYFSFGGNEYLVMDFVEGQDLEAIGRQHGALPEATVLGWAYQLLDALIYVHARNVIHRDIKPHNVIVKPDGRVMLVDFGLVKLLDPNNPNTATAMRGMGTAEYAPFEQYVSGAGHTDARSDIYSLGATMYHLLTGRAPIEVHQRMLNPAALPAPRALNPNISAPMEAAVMTALEVYPRSRFASAVEMKQALGARVPVTRTMPVGQQNPAHSAPISLPATMPKVKPTGSANLASSLLQFGLIVIGVLFVLGLVGVIGRLLLSNPPMPAPTSLTPLIVVSTPTIISPSGAITPTPNASAPTAIPTMLPISVQTQRRGKDNADMILVPVGEFTMGSNDGNDSEKPAHNVFLDSFWIDKFEVTNALYKRCVDISGCSAPSRIDSSTRDSYYGNRSFNDYPVIYASWYDASAYCTWAGKRLPTEAEWEKSARGTDSRTYPWGNTFDLYLVNSNERRVRDTTEVGIHQSGASPYGALDMAGNVSEWVADLYEGGYYAHSPTRNPKGPSSGQSRILRGGSWLQDLRRARASDRNPNMPLDRDGYFGFRCAQ